MNNFGLGLILNFTDNASAGMSSAARTFENLSATVDQVSASIENSAMNMYAIAQSMTQVGDTMMGVGGSILGVFTTLGSKIIDTGMTMQGFRMQLNALYGPEEGAAKIKEIQKYAETSVFEVESLMSAVTTMKAVGIEAMDSITTSSGQNTQTLMDYASDLAAMMPNMRNAYGTGVNAAMGAFKEYIAEGNAVSLKRGAGLDITGILGEDKGASVEERTQQVADLIEKLNIAGYTEKLYNTPAQQLSNINDVIFNSFSKIAESGVFDTFCQLLSTASTFIRDLTDDEERFGVITQLVADVVSTLMKPLQKLLDWVLKCVDAFVSFAAEHPVIAKNIALVVAALGGLLVAGGAVLKLSGNLLMLATSIQYLGGMGKVLGVLRKGFSTLFSTILPIVAIATTLYFAWKSNLFGLRDLFTQVFGDIIKVFSLAFDAWTDNTLSYDDYMLATKLGILPFIEAIMSLRYYWGYFVSGFKAGFKAFWDGLGNSFQFLNKFGIDVFGITEKIGVFLKTLLQVGQEDKWEAVGKAAGKIGALALSFYSLYKMLTMFKGLKSGLSALGNIPIFGSIFGGKGKDSSGGGSAKSGGFLSSPVTVLKTVTSLAIILSGLVILVTALGALATTPWFGVFISQGVNIIRDLSKCILPLAALTSVLGLLAAAMNKLKVSPSTALKGIANVAIMIGGFSVLITAIGALASIPGFSNFISTGVTTLSSVFSVMKVFTTAEFWAFIAATTLMGVITPATVASGLGGLAIAIGGVGLIVAAFGALAQIPGFDDFMQTGGDVLVSLFETIGRAVGALIGGLVGGAIESVVSVLPSVGTSLSQFGANLQPFFDTVKDAPLAETGAFMVAISEALLMLTADKLLSFFTGDIDLAGLGTNLASFATNAAPFFSTVATYSEDGLTKARQVFDVLGGIGGYEFKSGGLAQVFTGEVDLGRIGQQLAAFAPNGAIFFSAVEGYSDAGLEKSPRVFQALSGIGDYDFKFGGLAQLITGSTSLDIIGQQIAAFAPNGTTFFNTVADYSDLGIEKSPRVFQALSGIGDYDFKFGGLAQLITGSTGLDIIGQQLSIFAPYGTTFFSAVADYPEAGMDKAKKVFEALSGIGAYEFKSGGLAQWITGGTDLGGMGDQLTEFGENAKGFFDIADSYSDRGVENGTKAINLLSVIGAAGLSTGGLISLFTGSIDITSIAQQLAAFGTEAAKYFNAVSGLSDRAITNGSSVINVLKNLGNATFQSGGLVQLFTGTTDITNLTNNLSQFGQGSKDFFIAAGSLATNDINQGRSVISALSELENLNNAITLLTGDKLSWLGGELVTFIGNAETFFVKAGTLNAENVKNITDALKPFFDLVTTFDTSVLTTLSTGIDGLSTSTSAFSEAVSGIAETITLEKDNIVSALTECTESSNEILVNFADNGINIGSSLMECIAQGITSNTFQVQRALQNSVNNSKITIPSSLGTNLITQLTSQINSAVRTASSNVMQTFTPKTNRKTVPAAAKGVENFVGGLIQINEDGGELVELPSGSTVVPHDDSVTEALERGVKIGAESLAMYAKANATQPVMYDSTPQRAGDSYNVNVNLGAGAVVLQCANTSSAELEKAADKLIKIIQRKLELKKMAQRNTQKVYQR